MTQVRHLLGSASVETAKRSRICYRNRKQHNIPAGGVCLVVKEPSSGGSKNYCPACALAILDQATDDLQRLRALLTPATLHS